MAQNAPKVTAKLSPAHLVVDIFGEAGASAIAGVKIDATRRWRRRKASGGSGGLVPAHHQDKFLKAAEVLGKALTAEQLIAEPY